METVQDFSNKVLEEHVIVDMPIRLLKLPEMQLVDRSTVISLVTNDVVYQNSLPPNQAILEQAARSQRQRKPDIKSDNDAKKQVILNIVKAHTKYAVLSHTWSECEVAFDHTEVDSYGRRTVSGPNLPEGTGLDKLKSFCRIVNNDYNIKFAWMDTVCINKDKNANELDQSIASMFSWYSNSALCIVYLAQSFSIHDLPSDRWFTRGWTLQELLAPRKMAFYGRDWEKLASYDKNIDHQNSFAQSEICKFIELATRIPPEELYGFAPGGERGIASRMLWIAERVTSVQEDKAYCMMGIFGVKFSIAYGEGKRNAFARLVNAILTNVTNCLSAFNYAGESWGTDTDEFSKAIPSSPECYERHVPELNMITHYQPYKEIKLSQYGLKVRLLLVFSLLDRSDDLPLDQPYLFDLIQNQDRAGKIWDPTARVSVKLQDNSPFARARFTSKMCFAFGIWNFQEDEIVVTLPKLCAAFVFGFNLVQGHKDFPIGALTSKEIQRNTKLDTQNVILLRRCPRISNQQDPTEQLHIPKKYLALYGLHQMTVRI